MAYRCADGKQLWDSVHGDYLSLFQASIISVLTGEFIGVGARTVCQHGCVRKGGGGEMPGTLKVDCVGNITAQAFSRWCGHTGDTVSHIFKRAAVCNVTWLSLWLTRGKTELLSNFRQPQEWIVSITKAMAMYEEDSLTCHYGISSCSSVKFCPFMSCCTCTA